MRNLFGSVMYTVLIIVFCVLGWEILTNHLDPVDRNNLFVELSVVGVVAFRLIELVLQSWDLEVAIERFRDGLREAGRKKLQEITREQKFAWLYTVITLVLTINVVGGHAVPLAVAASLLTAAVVQFKLQIDIHRDLKRLNGRLR